MVRYIRKVNLSLIEQLVSDTVRTLDYNIENDLSDQDDYIYGKSEQIDQKLYDASITQLKIKTKPTITYSNYRKFFNKTLERFYKEQVNFKTNSFFISFSIFFINYCDE